MSPQYHHGHGSEALFTDAHSWSMISNFIKDKIFILVFTSSGPKSHDVQICSIIIYTYIRVYNVYCFPFSHSVFRVFFLGVEGHIR
jgi:hypothetical protein